MTDRSPTNSSYPQTPEARVSPGLFAPRSLLQNWLSISIDLLFPPRCAGCGRIDTFWCETCQHDLEQIRFPREVRQLPQFDGMASIALQSGKIREAVQALNYDNARVVARPLGERIAAHLVAQNWMFD